MRQDISGFRLDTELHQGHSSLVYRGVRLDDGLPVVLKILKNEFPTPQETARYAREHKIAGALRLTHAVRLLDLTREGHRSVLVYADDGCVSMRRLFGGRALDVATFLAMAIAIARALEEVHAERLIHCDINPANLLIHPQTRTVKLTDFELARRRGEDAVGLTHAMGTLAYMAPEQSGRTSLRADHRADLYSLGATLFELATGRQVFTDLDDAALLHAHFALAPPRICELRADFPPLLDDIVQKLLAKLPAERYQSASGLLADLERAQAQLERGEALAIGALGQSDRRLGIRHGERLIGSEPLLLALDAGRSDAAQASRALWLRLIGAAGSGKTALVARFEERLPAGKLVLTARFEQQGQALPYAGLIRAFDRLAEHWLSASESELDTVRDQLRRALGVNLGVIEPLLPRLAKIVGPLPRPLPLGASAEQARFQLAVRSFLQVAAANQQPLILFLDDLQWIDSASLLLLEHVLGGDLAPCLVISAERDDEPLPSVVDEMLARLAAAGLPFATHTLLPLSHEHIGELLDASLGRLAGGEEMRAALVEILQAKTLGNPFFIRQLLSDLVAEAALCAVRDEGGEVWQLDLQRAHSLAVADNVLSLLGSRIDSLSVELRCVLEHAACIGQHFDFATLAAIVPPALAAELPARLSELVSLGMLQTGAEAHTHEFIHPRIHEAAHDRQSESARAQIHLAIGRLWKAQPARGVFEVLGHLNHGMALLNDDAQREELSRLNALAASLARAQTAYESSLEYAGYALSLLPASSAQREPALARQLHVQLADAQASAGQLDAAIQVFEHALSLAESDDERAQVLERMCDALQTSGRPAEALVQVQRALAMLGHPLRLPDVDAVHSDADSADDDAQSVLDTEQAKLFAELGSESALASVSVLGDADAEAARVSKLYDKAIIAVYFSRPEMLGYVTARSVQHVLNTGLTPEASLAFAWWSMMLCMQDQHELATGYAQWVRTIHDRFGDDYYGGGGRMVATAMTLSWTLPYAENFIEAGESARLLHHSGNMQFSSYSLITQHIITVCEAASCQAMLDSCERWADYCARYAPLELGQAQIRRYSLQRLMGQDPAPLDCEAIVAAYAAQNNVTDVCESLTEMARFALLTDDYAAALALCERAHPYFMAGAAGNLLLNFNHWVMLAIASARVARGAGGELRERLRTQFETAAARVHHLSALQEQNFAGYSQLVRAEGALLHGQEAAALSAYFASIRHSQQHGYLLLQAQATQYLAELLRAQGHHFAYSVERDAEHLYQRAGCVLKVHERASLSATSTSSAATDVRTTPNTRSSDASRGIDVLSLMKANEAITSEIDYDRLLTRLLEITVENAGAQRGVLVLLENQQYFVVASTADGRLQELLEHSQRCPLQMIHYVARSALVTVLDSRQRRNAFRDEPYFSAHAVRSALAAPLLRQGKVCGVVYLENNAVDGAFGYERLEAIRLLLGGAAIALENASLYAAQKRYADELEQRVRERTLALETANAALARLANIDGLTQVANRRCFDLYLQRYADERASVCLLLCDVDDFKPYNDHYGHPAGDDVLRKVAAALSEHCPPSVGLVARYGGEEFALLLRDMDSANAERCAQHIQACVGKLLMPHRYARAAQHVTLSVGAARVASLTPALIGTLIADADKALYVAKQSGRNRLSLHADFWADS